MKYRIDLRYDTHASWDIPAAEAGNIMGAYFDKYRHTLKEYSFVKYQPGYYFVLCEATPEELENYLEVLEGGSSGHHYPFKCLGVNELENMNYRRAWMLANSLIKELQPHCVRVEIAGSIRRKKQYNIKDIEIVCVPKKEFVETNEPKQGELFGSPEIKPEKKLVVSPGFIEAVNKYEAVKGKPDGKYTQRKLPTGETLDLFMTEAETFGMIFAIRTGSAEWFKKNVANRWVQLGMKSEVGVLKNGKHDYYIREEQDLFKLLHIPYTKPEDREL